MDSKDLDLGESGYRSRYFPYAKRALYHFYQDQFFVWFRLARLPTEIAQFHFLLKQRILTQTNIRIVS